MTARVKPVGRTFRRRRAPLSEIYKDHTQAEASVDAVCAKFKVEIEDVEPIWRALRGEKSDEMLAQSVRWTMPTEHAPLVQIDEVAAVYALHCLCEALVAPGQFEVHDLEKDDLAARKAFTEAWKAFDERRLLANAVEEGFGCDESAAWHTLRATADRPGVEGKMRQIAELAGKMHRAMSRVATRVRTDDPQSVIGAETGGDPERLLPAEIAKLADPDLGDKQTMEILRRRAQQRKMRGVRSMTRGPLVLALDESGSMHDSDSRYRGRNTWAKACAVALTRIAHADNRHVRCVHFSTSNVVQDVPPGDHRAIWEMAHSFVGGGTDIARALRGAHKSAVELAKEGIEGADVVLVSDGGGPTDEDEIKAMKAAGVDLWSVAIGDDWYEDHPARKLAARYVFAHDRDLVATDRAVEMADQLTQAAVAREDLN